MYLSNYYKSGVTNVLCDVCGVKYKSDELRKRWDGFMVCHEDWEVRHPQDYIRGSKPQKAPEYTRPEPANTFVTVPYISESIGLQETSIPSGNSGTLGTL